jgi:dienelactone hydrolase
VPDLTDRLIRRLEVLKPEGPGPFSTLIILHGCGGLQPLQRRYAEAAVRQGHAVVLLDSFGPRGISRTVAQLTVCSGLQLRGAERAHDLLTVLHWLKTQAFCDPARIAAAGWSHGGWSIMEALVKAENPAEREILFLLRETVLIYPYCGLPALTASRGWSGLAPRVTAILGGKDAVAGHRLPRRALDRLSRDGIEVELHFYPDATHAFDDDQASDPRTRFSPELTARTEGHLLTALSRL